MDLSNSLKKFRKEMKVTQSQAAACAGVSVRIYQEYEYGKSVPTATVLIALADAYNVSLDYLCGRTENKEINQ